MVGTQSTVKGAQPVEYNPESTFDTKKSNADYNWIGLVDSASISQGVEQETVRALPPDGENAKLEYLQNVKISEAYEVEFTYAPQDANFPFSYYFMGASGSLSDSLTSITIGLQDEDNSEYNYLSGCVGEEWSLTIEEDSVAEVSASFIAADENGWSTTDYTGSGSHASEDTSTPFTYDDFGNVQLGGSSLSDAVNSFTLTVSNDLVVVKDPDGSAGTHIQSIVPVAREITAELDLTYDDFSHASTVRNYTANDLTYDFPDSGTTKSWTVSNTQFPEFPYEFAAEDLVGDTVASDPCDNLTFS